MEPASKCDRLASFVCQARALMDLACPTTACLLRVLDAQTPGDVEELGKWEVHAALRRQCWVAAAPGRFAPHWRNR